MRDIVEQGQTSGSRHTTVLSGLDDGVRRADDVAELHDLVCALRVDHHDAVGVLSTEGLDVFRPEALVHRTVALPEEERGLLRLALGEAAQRLARVPDAHVVGAVPQLVAGVPPEVLVREEEDAFSPLERPAEDGLGVGGSADRPALAADERLEGGGRVHIGDRDQAIDVDDLGELVPGFLDLVYVGHIGHRAAGIQVGQHHLLVLTG